jgi:ribosomal-protein-alanine N-acetyltransferase
MLRKFKIEDIHKILDIEEQAFPKTSYSKETFLSYAKSFPDSFIVAETDGDIVGYIIFDGSGHIYSTVVKPSSRRKGFGRILFLHALKSVKQRLWLEVRSKNSGAIAFYKRMGMKITEKISCYYGNDDALIMVLDKQS